MRSTPRSPKIRVIRASRSTTRPARRSRGPDGFPIPLSRSPRPPPSPSPCRRSAPVSSGLSRSSVHPAVGWRRASPRRSSSRSDRSPAPGDRFVLSTSIAPVTLRVGGAPADPRPGRVLNLDPAGGTLVDAEVGPADDRGGAGALAPRTIAAVLVVAALTLLLARRRTGRSAGDGQSIHAATLPPPRRSLPCSSCRGWFCGKQPPDGLPTSWQSPLELFLTALVAVAVVWVVVRPDRGGVWPGPARGCCASTQRCWPPRSLLVAGIGAAARLGLRALSAAVVAGTNVDLLHFSLHPFEPARLASHSRSCCSTPRSSGGRPRSSGSPRCLAAAAPASLAVS